MPLDKICRRKNYNFLSYGSVLPLRANRALPYQRKFLSSTVLQKKKIVAAKPYPIYEEKFLSYRTKNFACPILDESLALRACVLGNLSNWLDVLECLANK